MALGLLAALGGRCFGEDGAEGVEGTVRSVRAGDNGAVVLELGRGSNSVFATVQQGGGLAPQLASRVRLRGLSVSNWDEVRMLAGALRPVARSVANLRRLDELGQSGACVAELNADVLAVSPNGKAFALCDGSGVILAETKMSLPVALEAGEAIHIEGDATVEGARVFFESFPVVDNDGIHRARERSGKVYLTAGLHPIRLDWFNHLGFYGLEVFYQGPRLRRMRIPASALFFSQNGRRDGERRYVNGLSYRDFEGGWLRLPEFDKLIPARRGLATNFVTSVETRSDDVGLDFTGWIEAPGEGVYTFFTISDDGSLLYLDEAPPSVEVVGSVGTPRPQLVVGQQSLADSERFWAQAEGTVTFASVNAGEARLELSAEKGRIEVELADASQISPETLLNARLRVTGLCLPGRAPDGRLVAATLLAPGAAQIEFWQADGSVWSNQPVAPALAKPEEAVGDLPVLTTVAEIKRLSRDQWERGYPVKIRGVVTSVLDSGVFIEDSTWSIYARWMTTNMAEAPRIGDYWEMEGKTFVEFAPNILVSRASRLGAGALPEPLRPSWDQLLNGSLDTKYVELQGIVSEVASNTATLLTPAGKLSVNFLDLQPQALRRYDNALIRARGCVIPGRDRKTDQIEPGGIQLASATISVDQPAPSDPFAVPLKRASDLLLFDWRAGALQRVRIAGQVMHAEGGECFLMDGRQGVRIIPKNAVPVAPGDLIEAVGFVELGAPSPVVREAILRHKGVAPLPPAQMLGPNVLLDRRRDCRRVMVQATLAAVSRDSADDVLEMHAGGRGFVARLPSRNGPLPPFAAGSLLQLTGIYAGQDGDLFSGREVTSFELLLNSPADIEVLARPPWWTAGRALAAVGSLALVVLIGVVWIALLRKRVEERSQQLAAEVRRHEHTDRQRELEAERARIARDLHDDLGAALTQIRFLSAVESRDMRAPESTRSRLEQVSKKSRDMVESLDEIVWAINPSNDSVASLANYFSHFAEEFFSATPIRCRLDVADALPPAPLTSEVRHHLYLTVREAMNNIAKHSAATEVWLRIHAGGGTLSIVLEDNGRGFASAAGNGAGDGLANMRERMERIHGQFCCESRPGAGSEFHFSLPLVLRAANGAGPHVQGMAARG